MRNMASSGHRSEQPEHAPDLRLVINSTPALIHTGLPDGYLDFFNQTWLQYVGRSLQDLEGWKWTASIHPEDVDEIVDKWRASLASGEPFLHEARVRRSDGEFRWMLHHKVGLRDEHGKIVKWFGSSIDIEDRKRVEDSLRLSEAYMAQAQQLTRVGSWAYKPPDICEHWSAEMFRIFGFDPSKGYPSNDEVAALVHPEDRQRAEHALTALFNHGQIFDQKYRYIRPDGQLRVIRDFGAPVFENGVVTRFVGACLDITEEEQRIEELRRSEFHLREQEAGLRQILDLAPQLVAVFGPDSERLYANRILLDYLGVTLEEWRRKFKSAVPSYHIQFVHPDDWDRVTAHSARAISDGAAFELEMRLRKSDGSYRWFLARYNPLHAEEGQITRWYVTGTDIEERKQTEERLSHENVALREEIVKASMFEEIVGTSPALRAVLSRVAKVGPTDSTVLLTGETGTGKELIARAVHKRSQRSSRAFVSVNCAAIPTALIASELFGHEKGAFTGALQRRVGRFELADGGTIFLDEVGELPMETQIALLRVLQEREFERVGGNQAIRADVRVIAATNRDLEAAITAGDFRRDLFYRLNVFPLEIPSLRERKDDIPMLVEYFIDRYARKTGKKMRSIDKKTLVMLQSYSWPGNIRELQNVIERSVIVCETENFSVDESWLSEQPSNRKAESQPYLSEKVAAQEKETIEAALRESQGRVSGPSGAAAKLGIARSTLESKIRSLKINKNSFRATPGT